MFDKALGSWSCAAIKQVAQTKDYYPPETEARLANEVESPGHAALNTLRRGEQLTPQARDDLAYYVAVFMMRGPRKRRKALELVPSVLDTTVSDLRQELSDLRTDSNSGRIDHLLSEVERVERKYREELPSTVTEQVANPWPSNEVVALVRSMVWRVARMPRDRFLVTTDNPAFFFESYGVGTDRAEITFPIDSQTALLGSHQGQPGSTLFIGARALLAKEINRRVASGAERFIFSPRRATWIETLAIKSNPFLSRIEW
jgi:hypothetical protein